MEDINLIDYFAEKNLYELDNVNVFNLSKLKNTAKEIQPFVPNIPLHGYFSDFEHTKLRLKFSKDEIYFLGTTANGTEIKITTTADNNLILKFLTALLKIKQEMKYAVFIVEDFTEKLDPFFAYLFIKAFLYGREEERSQLFFSSRNPYLLSKDIIRSDALYFVDSKIEHTQKATEFENNFEWVNTIKNYLPKEEIKKKKRKKMKTSDLILIAIIIFSLFYFYINYLKLK